MLFEIFSADGRRVEWTDHAEYIPSKAVLLQRQNDGYKFKLDGKDFDPMEKKPGRPKCVKSEETAKKPRKPRTSKAGAKEK